MPIIQTKFAIKTLYNRTREFPEKVFRVSYVLSYVCLIIEFELCNLEIWRFLSGSPFLKMVIFSTFLHFLTRFRFLTIFCYFGYFWLFLTFFHGLAINIFQIAVYFFRKFKISPKRVKTTNNDFLPYFEHIWPHPHNLSLILNESVYLVGGPWKSNVFKFPNYGKFWLPF